MSRKCHSSVSHTIPLLRSQFWCQFAVWLKYNWDIEPWTIPFRGQFHSGIGIDFQKSVGIGIGIDFVGIIDLILLIFTPKMYALDIGRC